MWAVARVAVERAGGWPAERVLEEARVGRKVAVLQEVGSMVEAVEAVRTVWRCGRM